MPNDIDSIPYSWVRNELKWKAQIKRGQRNDSVKRVQEWCSIHGFATGIDRDFGPATETVVKEFQKKKSLPTSGKVDRQTWEALVQPMFNALKPIAAGNKSAGELVSAYGRQHLKHHPVEVGGQNCGPWVRMYMKGNEGHDWPWCAGFVCFLMREVYRTLGKPMPIQPTFSCDVLAERAKNKGIFIRENSSDQNALPPGSIFLNRRIPGDWTHTGIVMAFENETIKTLEGNTNDEGSREGYEVCARVRGYKKRDFIKLV